jgi:hypothetical protein
MLLASSRLGLLSSWDSARLPFAPTVGAHAIEARREKTDEADI